jgi:hypothetical protein
MRALRALLAGGASLLGTTLFGTTLFGTTLFGTTAAEAAAVPISQCTTSSGVVLAVDFGHWGGPILRACGSTPTTGYTLLNQGGWRSSGTQRDGPGFICRIGYSGYRGWAAFPSAAEQNCVNTPPTTAYWSYWYAGPGQTGWTYSEDGAQSHSPQPGSVDLWAFGGSGSSPRVSPDSVRAHNSSPGAPNSAPPSHSAPAGGSRSSAAGGGTASSAGNPVGRATASQRASSPTATAGGGSTGGEGGLNHAVSRSATALSSSGVVATGPAASASDSGAPPIVDAEPTAAARSSSGSVLPGLITAGLVLTLGAIAAVAGWRRRQVR